MEIARRNQIEKCLFTFKAFSSGRVLTKIDAAQSESIGGYKAYKITTRDVREVSNDENCQ